MFIQYARTVDWSANLINLGLDADGYVTCGQKTTTGAPAATAGRFIAGAIIQNKVSGLIYQNTGSTASPSWSAMAAGSGITALTGDVTASGTGSVAATIANNAVTTVKINDGAVTTPKIADNAVTGAKIALASQAAGTVMYYNGTDWVILAIGTAGQVLTVNAGATAPEWQTP